VRIVPGQVGLDQVAGDIVDLGGRLPKAATTRPIRGAPAVRNGENVVVMPWSRGVGDEVILAAQRFR